MNDFLFASRFYKIAADSSKVTLNLWNNLGKLEK